MSQGSDPGEIVESLNFRAAPADPIVVQSIHGATVTRGETGEYRIHLFAGKQIDPAQRTVTPVTTGAAFAGEILADADDATIGIATLNLAGQPADTGEQVTVTVVRIKN